MIVPFPPSLNRYYRTYRGRVTIAEAGLNYRKEIDDLMYETGQQKFGNRRVSVDIVANPPDRRRRDLDNMLKAVLDALEHSKIYDNDSQIDDLRIRRGEVVKDGNLEIRIKGL